MVEYRYIPETGLLVVTVAGIVQASDFPSDIPDVPVGTRELFDLSGVERMDISSDQVHGVARRDERLPNRISRMAIVATSDVGFGLARMYQALSDEMKTEVQVFRDRAEACAWLGIEDPAPL